MGQWTQLIIGLIIVAGPTVLAAIRKASAVAAERAAERKRAEDSIRRTVYDTSSSSQPVAPTDLSNLPSAPTVIDSPAPRRPLPSQRTSPAPVPPDIAARRRAALDDLRRRASAPAPPATTQPQPSNWRTASPTPPRPQQRPTAPRPRPTAKPKPQQQQQQRPSPQPVPEVRPVQAPATVRPAAQVTRPPAHPATLLGPRISRADLRRAFIMKEILDPPLALREDSPAARDPLGF